MEGSIGNKIKEAFQNPYKRLAALIIKQVLLDYRDNINRKDCLEFLNSNSYVFDVLNYEKAEKEKLKNFCKFFDSPVTASKKAESLCDYSAFCRLARKNKNQYTSKKLAAIANSEPFVFETSAPPI